MKNLIALSAAFILASGFTVPTKKITTLPDSAQTSKYTLSFSKIIIEDDIDVTILESNERSIDIAGSKQDLSKVQWKIKNGVLYLGSKWGSLKDRVLVTLSVKGLNEINVNGESTVKSLGNINSASLNVYMNGLGYVDISNAGKINVINGTGIKLEVKKKTANVSVLAGES